MVKAWIIKDKKRRKFFYLEEDRRRSLKIFKVLLVFPCGEKKSKSKLRKKWGFVETFSQRI